jgi:hypothetical protein
MPFVQRAPVSKEGPDNGNFTLEVVKINIEVHILFYG